MTVQIFPEVDARALPLETKSVRNVGWKDHHLMRYTYIFSYPSATKYATKYIIIFFYCRWWISMCLWCLHPYGEQTWGLPTSIPAWSQYLLASSGKRKWWGVPLLVLKLVIILLQSIPWDDTGCSTRRDCKAVGCKIGSTWICVPQKCWKVFNFSKLNFQLEYCYRMSKIWFEVFPAAACNK